MLSLRFYSHHGYIIVAALSMLFACSPDDGDDGDDGDPRGVATIDSAFGGLTLVNVIEPPAGRQAFFGDLLLEALDEEVALQPGFVSASVHRSLDNDYLVNYAKWESPDAVEAFGAEVEAGAAPKLAEVFAETTSEFHPYAIAQQVHKEEGPVRIDDRYWTMINVLVPDDTTMQSSLSELLGRAMREEAAAQPGFVSASVHVSLDNEYVLNYAQWSDASALEAFGAKVAAGEAPLLGAAFARARAEFHPYGDIHTIEAR